MSSKYPSELSPEQIAVNPNTRVEMPYPNPMSDESKEKAFKKCLEQIHDPQKFHQSFNAQFRTQEIFDILLFAIRNGSHEQCILILHYISSNNIDFEEPGDEHAALIPEAIKKGFKTLTLSLIKRIPNIIEIKDVNGNCPIHYAIYQQDPDLIKALMAAKVNLNTPNAAGLNPLSIAIEVGNFPLFSALIKNGANVNSPHDRSPLVIACAFKDREKFVESLLCEGAVINAKNAEGKSPSKIALDNGNKKSLKIMNAVISFTNDLLEPKTLKELQISFSRRFQGINPAALNCNFFLSNEDITAPTILVMASNGKEEELKMIQNLPLKFNTTNSVGWNILHYAIAYGSKNLFNFALSKGCKVNTPIKSGITPSMLAAIYYQPRMFQHLSRVSPTETHLSSGQSFVNLVFSDLTAEQINKTLAVIAGTSLSAINNGFVDIESEIPHLDTSLIKSRFINEDDFRVSLSTNPHLAFYRNIAPRLQYLDIDRGKLVADTMKELHIDSMDIADYDTLFHHEKLTEPGNSRYKRAIQESPLIATIIARKDPKILRIALYAGLDLENPVYTMNENGEMEYQNPEDKIFEEKNTAMINELFLFLGTCNNKGSRVFKRCTEYFKDQGFPIPKIATLPSLHAYSEKENDREPKRYRPQTTSILRAQMESRHPSGPRGLRQ